MYPEPIGNRGKTPPQVLVNCHREAVVPLCLSDRVLSSVSLKKNCLQKGLKLYNPTKALSEI
jgi:hypothetical protein